MSHDHVGTPASSQIVWLEDRVKVLEEHIENSADVATIAIRKAFQLGQTYWQQADSDSYSQHAKSEVTYQKLIALCDSVFAEITNV